MAGCGSGVLIVLIRVITRTEGEECGGGVEWWGLSDKSS